MIADASEIRALLFDTFGTVVDWRAGVAREVATLFAALGIPCEAETFADAWRTRYQPAMEPIRQGTRAFVPLDVIHRENLDYVLASWPGGEEVDSEMRDRLALAWHRLDPWPDSVEGLTTLKKDYLIAPLSNGNVSLLTNMAKRAGLPWDCILGAEVVRAYKPQPSVYIDTAALLGLQPRQCVMVAAHNNDLAAAHNTGMRTAFVYRRTEHGPGQTTDLHPERAWDFIVEDLVELAELLRRP